MTYESSYLTRDGARISGHADVVESARRSDLSQAEAERRWIATLRDQGVKAAHPDDGWVDRESNTIKFCYPQFDDTPQVGDRIALGWPWRYRVVAVTAISTWGIISQIPCYSFSAAMDTR